MAKGSQVSHSLVANSAVSTNQIYFSLLKNLGSHLSDGMSSTLATTQTEYEEFLKFLQVRSHVINMADELLNLLVDFDRRSAFAVLGAQEERQERQATVPRPYIGSGIAVSRAGRTFQQRQESYISATSDNVSSCLVLLSIPLLFIYMST